MLRFQDKRPAQVIRMIRNDLGYEAALEESGRKVWFPY